MDSDNKSHTAAARSTTFRITWPKAFGGRGDSPIQEVIYRKEEARFNVPNGIFNVSLGMVIPSLFE